MSKIYVTQSSMPEYEEYCEMIKSIFNTHILTNNGPLHQQFQDELKQYLNVGGVNLFTNGHTALEYAIEYFDFKPGSEIITTPFTFTSTVNAIVRKNLVPIFCDINENDYTIDVNKIEDLITENTVAILPVHVYGNICDVNKIDEIAKKYNLKVIYDGAHAFGEKYNNIDIGNFGDITMFSFHATKVFNTIEGGCLTTKDQNKQEKLNELKNFGIIDQDNIDYIGGNGKMNEFCAAMGLCNLKHLDDNILKRCIIYKKYVSELCNTQGIVLNKMKDNIDYNYSYFPIVITDYYPLTREQLIKKLNENDIYPRKYFYPLVNETTAYSKYEKGNTPIALKISNSVLTLPLYADLTLEEVEKICNIIKNVKTKSIKI